MTESAALAAVRELIERERLEEYDEWRLTGQPPSVHGVDFPFYDFTARTPEHIQAVRDIWAKADGRGWTDVKLVRRHVVITRTEWVEVPPATPEP